VLIFRSVLCLFANVTSAFRLFASDLQSEHNRFMMSTGQNKYFKKNKSHKFLSSEAFSGHFVRMSFN